MAPTVLKLSRKGLWLFVISGLCGLVIIILWWRNRLAPREVILKVLQANGISFQTAKMWVAISAFETATDGVPWTSRVFKDSKNLFGLIVPGMRGLPYGEGQTIFSSLTQCVQALYDRVIVPFSYPRTAIGVDYLVGFMKGKGYFQGDQQAYAAGVKAMYKKIFNETAP